MVSRIAQFFRLSRRELIVLVAVFVVSLPAITTRLYSSDEVEYYSYLRSLWFDHDVSFENDYQGFYERNIGQSPGFHETFLERTTEAGRRINFATVGCALLWAPVYGLVDLAVRGGVLGRQLRADGFSHPYIAAVAYASALYGFVAVLLSIRAARIVTGRGLAAGIAVWIGTPLLFYMYVAPPMSHATSAFGVALFVTAWLYTRETWSPARVAMLGLSAASMAMVREQDVFFVVGPAVDFVLALVTAETVSKAETVGRRIAAAAAGVTAFVIGYLPQLLAYNALNGRTLTVLGVHVPGPSKLVSRKMSLYAPHALQVLSSPEHGFVFWTPLAIVAIAGLLLLAFSGTDLRARRVGICALVMIAVQVYISGSVESWTVAGAFGQRRFVALTALLTVGLAALEKGTVPSFRLMEWKKGTVPVFVMLCIWWNLALMAEFGLRLMDRQRLELRSNAYHAFVTIPRLAPALAYRYFADRSSFYEHRHTGQ